MKCFFVFGQEGFLISLAEHEVLFVFWQEVFLMGEHEVFSFGAEGFSDVVGGK